MMAANGTKKGGKWRVTVTLTIDGLRFEETVEKYDLTDAVTVAALRAEMKARHPSQAEA